MTNLLFGVSDVAHHRFLAAVAPTCVPKVGKTHISAV